VQLAASVGTGVPPFVYAVTTTEGTMVPCNATTGFIEWAPADTGVVHCAVSVADAIGNRDVITPTIHVVGPNRPCSLSVRSSIAFGDSGILDLTRATMPETLFFTLTDPDPPDVEQHRMFIRQLGIETMAAIDSSGTVRVIVDPLMALVDRDTIRVIGVDRGGLADTMFQVVQYFLPRLRVSVNTGVTEAGVNGTVTDFPLLIRLTAANFDFSRIKSTGAGISFVKLDGRTVLPHEIEQWDSAGQSAALWVRIDTIFGNGTTSFFLVRDRKAVAPISTPSAVFDTGIGFMGVWHLNEAPVDTGAAGLYYDATANHNDGWNYVTAPGKTGLIGPGQQFHQNGDCILPKNNPKPLYSFTFSAWLNVQTYNISDQFVFTDFDWNNHGFAIRFFNADLLVDIGRGNNVYNTQARAPGLLTSGWMHLAVVWNNGTATFYRNGVRFAGTDETTDQGPLVYSAGYGVQIGATRYAGTKSMEGYVDEVRLDNPVRSADWVKLNYESQKPLSTIVSVQY
jgi:hypothetical protein